MCPEVRCFNPASCYTVQGVKTSKLGSRKLPSHINAQPCSQHTAARALPCLLGPRGTLHTSHTHATTHT